MTKIKNDKSEATRRASNDELAREVEQWEAERPPWRGFVEAPDAVPRASASESISIRMPSPLLRVVKAFAKRQGVGYQVLIKQWLDDRVRHERERLAQGESVAARRSAPTFPLVDRSPGDGPHYRTVH